ncbi:MAG: hypothetical protein IJI26_00185 [Clostridia bacterium]|nr:hypothetical protein [Clostridia bacterium]
MTNRQALMNWMEGLTTDDFIRKVIDRSSDLPERLDNAACRACEALHDGHCPRPDEDAECPFTLADWLDMENGGRDPA